MKLLKVVQRTALFIFLSLAMSTGIVAQDLGQTSAVDWSGFWLEPPDPGSYRYLFVPRGSNLVITYVYVARNGSIDSSNNFGTAVVSGREFHGGFPGGMDNLCMQSWSMPSSFSGRMSDDGTRIEIKGTTHAEYPAEMPEDIRAFVAKSKLPSTWTITLIRE